MNSLHDFNNNNKIRLSSKETKSKVIKVKSNTLRKNILFPGVSKGIIKSVIPPYNIITSNEESLNITTLNKIINSSIRINKKRPKNGYSNTDEQLLNKVVFYAKIYIGTYIKRNDVRDIVMKAFKNSDENHGFEKG